MAKKTTEVLLLDKALDQIRDLWEKRAKKFMQALDDSDRKRIDVVFTVTLDLSESAPIIDTQISFRDKCKESGMNVTKTLRDSTSERLEDPRAPGLPGLAKNKEETSE